MKTAILAVAALVASSAAAAQVTNTQVVDGSPPERDARGIPVISAPAVVPPGANQAVQVQPGARVVPAPNQMAVFSTRPSSRDYPPCTREVTDNCVQAYVGRRR